MKTAIYLDHAAATPMDPRVARMMQPFFSSQFYNPSATYLAARGVSETIEAARSKVAIWLGARPSEVVFTAGGTEANNLAVHGVMQKYPDCNLIVSSIEHESVLEPAKKYSCRYAAVSRDGVVDIESIKAKIDDKTVLVSVMYANNEIGTIQPIKQIAKLIESVQKDRLLRRVKLPLLLHTDACQAGAYMDLHVKQLGVDLMTLNGGKIYGPKQSGCLFIRSGVEIEAQILGGGQELGRRSGTQNVAAIIGFSCALNIVQSRRHQEVERLTDLQNLFRDLLSDQIPAAQINGSLKQRLPNNVHITIAGNDNERLMMILDEKGIQCAVGSACSASSELPSHVLKSIGLSDSQARSSLRFSMGLGTNKTDIKKTVATLAACL